MVGDIIKCMVIIDRIVYFSNKNWGIVNAKLISTKEGTPQLSASGHITIVGIMAEPKEDDEYYLTAKEVGNPKYGLQYEVICMANVFDSVPHDSQSKRKFLLSIFTPKQVKSMYEALGDPYDSLEKKRVDELIKISGVGPYTANLWMDRFDSKLPLSQVYLGLEEYNLSNNMIKSLLREYKSADLVVEVVKSNPYSLCKIAGIGWKTADKIALQGGIEQYSPIRISEYIQYYMRQEALRGFSYITSEEVMGALIDNFGEDIPDLAIAEAINSSSDVLWWNKEKTKIGLKKYYNLEDRIATEVKRILDSDNDFSYNDWKKIIKTKEIEQGWEYTDEQILGITTALENNLVVIHGLAGTGKTSIVDGLLTVLSSYSKAQTALSGRAAARLSEVTHEEGFTIHRLLGYPRGDELHGGYLYNNDNYLDYDIIIVDEISMIGGYQFYYLLRAVKSGAKVILLGDIGQLESIGECNVAYDLIQSPYIPTVYLSKIYRQAQKSAIITESKKIREGIQIVPQNYVGSEIRGELQDLIIDCYSDKSNTFYKVMQYVSLLLESVKDIMEIQIISPVKTRGDSSVWNLNNAIQELYNPKRKDEKEIIVNYDENRSAVLRAGDKVINTVNNYKAVLYDTGENTEIYNGSLGLVTKILSESEMVVSFQDIGDVLIMKDTLKNIELAYAITAHKSQGSQFDYVILALDYSAYSLLSKELVYTMMTRARAKCYMVAQTSALRMATSKEGVQIKQTHLKEILNGLFNPKLIF